MYDTLRELLKHHTGCWRAEGDKCLQHPREEWPCHYLGELEAAIEEFYSPTPSCENNPEQCDIGTEHVSPDPWSRTMQVCYVHGGEK